LSERLQFQLTEPSNGVKSWGSIPGLSRLALTAKCRESGTHPASFLQGLKGRNVKLTTHLYLVPYLILWILPHDTFRRRGLRFIM